MLSQNVPIHVAIILDGNRRQARRQGQSPSEGHLSGYEKVKQCPDWFFKRGVKVLTFYAFSTENWKRPDEEVSYLMKLVSQAVSKDMLEEALKRGYKVLLSGRIDELPGNLPNQCYEIVKKTSANNSKTIHICLNYGGRAEIVDAVRRMMEDEVRPERVDEEMLRKYLYQPNLPYPDIIVRTSGEQRMSNFLLWQGAYSELLFPEVYWPDFEEADVEFILKEYGQRKRRFGG